MSFLLTCPNCGEREVTDFAYGGEVVSRPATKPSERELNAYNYFRRNVAGRPARVVVSPLRAAGPGFSPSATRPPTRCAGSASRSDEPPPPQPRASGSTASARSRSASTASRSRRSRATRSARRLHAAGRRVLSRSFKYHRPRGLFCCAGQCPNCLVEVDGWPGVRACTEPVREGMRVAHMNATPSLRFDLMRATDLFGKRLTPPGFYYKTFIRPRRLWPLYEKVLRHAAGLGRLPRRQAEREWRTEYRRRHADVLVIGGGVAGMAAALRAAELGADVVLVDDGPELGGALLAGDGADAARASSARASAPPGSRCSPRPPRSASSTGSSPSGAGSTLHQVRADRHVAATGSIEQPLMFEGNDLPGVMLCSGAQRLASLYGVRPGRGRGRRHHRRPRPRVRARAARGRASRSSAIADARPSGADGELVGAARAGAGIPLLRGSAVVRALGRRRVRGAVVAELDAAGRWIPDTERGINCDLVAVSGGTVPATSLLLQAGAKARWDAASGAYLPDGAPAGHPRRGRGRRATGRTRARRDLGRRRRGRGRALARARRRARPGAASRRARGAEPRRPSPPPRAVPAPPPVPPAGTASASPACART